MFLKSITVALLMVVSITSASALDRRFSGRWRITAAEQAPWAEASEIDPAEAKELVGKQVVFAAKAVVGPSPLRCKPPSYDVREGDGPEMLFEGNLAGTDKAGKTRDTAALARAIGMTTPTVATLEVGCTEVSFHALGPDRLVFALDNQIYTLMRLGN